MLVLEGNGGLHHEGFHPRSTRNHILYMVCAAGVDDLEKCQPMDACAAFSGEHSSLGARLGVLELPYV